MSVIVKEHGDVKRVTIYENGKWLLQMNDVNGECRHKTCDGPVSYYVYYDEDGFPYTIKPPLEFYIRLKINASWTQKNI